MICPGRTLRISERFPDDRGHQSYLLRLDPVGQRSLDALASDHPHHKVRKPRLQRYEKVEDRDLQRIAWIMPIGGPGSAGGGATNGRMETSLV